jgi:aldehyde dehydrogenase (NAD+)
LKLGDPLDPTSEMGPAATEPQFKKILAMIERAREEGATVAYGGEPAPQGGFFVKPTILTNVTPDMTIAQDEVFGPILSVLPFDTEEEAIAIANDVRYGLAAGVWTESLRLAHRVIGQLRAGTVWVNAYKVTAPYGPFGGFKHSGIGRENGRDGLAEYLETKTVWIKMR